MVQFAPPTPQASDEELRRYIAKLERALRLARMALSREEASAHDIVAVIDNALVKPA